MITDHGWTVFSFCFVIQILCTDFSYFFLSCKLSFSNHECMSVLELFIICVRFPENAFLNKLLTVLNNDEQWKRIYEFLFNFWFFFFWLVGCLCIEMVFIIKLLELWIKIQSVLFFVSAGQRFQKKKHLNMNCQRVFFAQFFICIQIIFCNPSIHIWASTRSCTVRFDKLLKYL